MPGGERRVGRVFFMDLLYAAIISNALAKMDSSAIHALFFAQLVLIVVIFEDCYLFYTDVAPANEGGAGVGLLGLIFEICVLISWYFAFLCVAGGSPSFYLWYGVFFGLRVLSGLVFGVGQNKVLSWFFFRDLFYLISIGASFYLLQVGVGQGVEPLAASILGVLGPVWVLQTVLWWTTTAFVVRRA